MSYCVHISCDDSISIIRLWVNGVAYLDVYSGNSYYSEDYGLYFDSDDEVKFEAFAEDGYEFLGWEFYIGNDASAYTVEDNPFIYDGVEDIEISAIAEELPYSVWKLRETEWEFIDEEISFYMDVCENKFFRYKVIFRSSGTAYFYTDNSYSNVIAWVSETDTYDEAKGVPDDYIEADIDGADVAIECEVEAGVPYYVWIRGQSMYEDEVVGLYIESPYIYRPDTFAWTYAKEQGGEFNLTAKEWNAFTQNINDVRAYYCLENYAFDKAVKGDEFRDYIYNDARYAIEEMFGELNDYAPIAIEGQPVTAHMLNYIVDDVLNTI